jgi:lysophospholipase L1-like esterase
MSKVLSILSKELLAFAVIELVIRACVAMGLLSLPSMNVGGFDRFHQGEDPPAEKRLYEADRNLIYRLRANASIEYPRTVLFPNKPTTWTVRTNAQGFRSAPFGEAKRAGVFRILCLGDSSTFGMNVEDADAYPQVLQRLLDARALGRFEVVNLGVPGYSSRQGLELLRQKALGWQPDLLIFAFGTNDRFWHRTMSDDQVVRFGQSLLGAAWAYIRDGVEQVYSYRLLRRLATAMAQRLFGVPALHTGPLRVSLEEMQANILSGDALLRAQGSALLLVNSDFYRTDAIEAARQAAERTGDRLLNMARLFSERTRQRTAALGAQYGLVSPKPPRGMALFRVRGPAPGRAVRLRVRPYLDQDWSDVPMRDDGQAGDERAGDGVWSCLVPAGPGAKLSYAYWSMTGSGWVREFGETVSGTATRLRVVPTDAPGDIDTLGEYYLQSDAAHPDEEGHRLIADTLLPVILEAAGPVEDIDARKPG